MLPIAVYPVAIVALSVGLFLYAKARQSDAERRRREARKREWGKRREASSHGAEALARYHAEVSRERGDDGASVDATTWRDLDMDAVFAEIDRTTTFAGAARLHDRLRSPSLSRGSLESLRRFDVLATRLGDAVAREQVEPILASNASPLEAGILEVLFGDLPAPPAARFAFPLLSVATVLAVVASFALPAARIALLVLSIVSLAARFRYGKDAVARLDGFRRVNHLLGVGWRLARIRSAALEPELGAVRALMQRLAPLQRATSWLLFDALRANELVAIGVAYLNTFLLLDLMAVSSGLDLLRRGRADLHALFAGVGDLDAAIAVASFRAGVSSFTRPEIVPDARADGVLELDDAVHPLVENAVPNGIRVEDRGVLVTGGNMSGKSTLVRAVAVNALLAQTIYTTLTSRYRAPVLRVRTLMSAADDVQRNRSYYFAELEGAKTLLSPSAPETRTLVILDELFRGTNTSERIGAGKAVLDALVRAGHFVFASTHDRELVELLAATFDAYHFGEDVVGGELVFPYDLRRGPSTTRNAILLMRIAGFPEAVVGDATAVVERIETR